jgi:hypothetical protein
MLVTVMRDLFDAATNSGSLTAAALFGWTVWDFQGPDQQVCDQVGVGLDLGGVQRIDVA